MCYHVGFPSKADLKVKLPETEIRYDQGKILHVSGFERPYLHVTMNNNMDIVETASWKLLPF